MIGMRSLVRNIVKCSNHNTANMSQRIKRFQSQVIPINKTEVNFLKVSSETEIDWDKEMKIIKQSETQSVLAPTDEDFSHVTKNAMPSFNLAPFVNNSEVLQSLIKLGVDLHRLEKRDGVPEAILKLNFEKDVQGHLIFLSDFVDADLLGHFLSKNPLIFTQSIDDMQTRINYLESKNFTKNMVKRIVARNPFWLMFNTLRIDKRLGYFQQQFKLLGNEVRFLATKQPRLITYKLHHVQTNTFSIKEEMGFTAEQMKIILLLKPRLWMINNASLNKRFLYVHNTMKIPHEAICNEPQILTCRDSKIKQRHTFLEKLGMDQFDCTKPNYVSLTKLIEGTDVEFCENVAKCSIHDFNVYLKSL